MDITRYRKELNDVIPGVVEAYESLKTDNGMGLYTSNGAFYNHTFFGRDSAMSAKFVADFDHQTARESIIALAALQGINDSDVTGESAGKIHHEFRDLKTWRGGIVSKLVVKRLYRRWGGRDKQIQTYFAMDTTALFVRLVYKYAVHIDKSILEKSFVNQAGEKLTISEALERAADWLSQQMSSGFVTYTETNPSALPYQTFQDSATAFPKPDGHLANFRKGIAYTEVQAFSYDAIHQAAQLLNENEKRHEWKRRAHEMRNQFMNDFWSETEKYFGSARDKDGLVDMPTITAGWTLNTGLWDEVNEYVRIERVSAIVKRLFSNDFLTDYGLRTRSLNAPQPLKGVVEYHGRLTMWPMFTFMVIEGLRHHKLFALAEQLEHRLINGLNLAEHFDEFLVIDESGHILKPTKKSATTSIQAQMLPERRIGFSVVPAMTLAWRQVTNEKTNGKQLAWQQSLETEVLAGVPTVSIMDQAALDEARQQVIGTRYRRFKGNVRSAWYFYNERKRM